MRNIVIALTLAAAAGSALQAADAAAGKAVYEKSCKSCHGPDGTPNAAIAKMMKVDMRDLKSPDVQAASDDELKKIVTDGKGKMKGTAGVSGAAAENVVAYMRTWKK
jgi:mono/diheme cytochrome c family protein